MRCNNCGWLNKPSLTNCEKCKFPLSESSTNNSASGDSLPTTGNNKSDSLSKTIKGSPALGDAWDTGNQGTWGGSGTPPQPPIETVPLTTPNTLPNTNINPPPPPSPPDFVPSTNTVNVSTNPIVNPVQPVNPVTPPQPSNPFKATYDPSRQRIGVDKEITLKLLPKDGESETKIMVLKGDSIVLNRANVDPDNYSITSAVQAEIEYINGEWHIIDKSDLQTSFVQLSKPYKLEKGDIILLGNRKLIVESD